MKDELALGMQDLHWGMSPEQVRQIYPDFEAAPVPHLADPSPSFGGSDIYARAGCTFRRVFYFWHGRLIKVHLYSDGATPCRDQIEAELTTQYGLEARTTVPPFLPAFKTLDYRWSGAVTAAAYAFTDPGIVIDFADASINARPEGIYFFRCESVGISFLPSGGSDGISNPAVDRSSVNLDCEYPISAISARWSGSVSIHVQIRADGSVAGAQLVNPNATSNQRIFDEPTLDMVRTRLRFHPATKDGVAIAVERDMVVTFRTVRTVRFVT